MALAIASSINAPSHVVPLRTTDPALPYALAAAAGLRL